MVEHKEFEQWYLDQGGKKDELARAPDGKYSLFAVRCMFAGFQGALARQAAEVRDD